MKASCDSLLEDLNKIGHEHASELAAKDKELERVKKDSTEKDRLMQLRLFRTNSDSMKYLAGDLEITDEKVDEYGFETIFDDIVKQIDNAWNS